MGCFWIPFVNLCKESDSPQINESAPYVCLCWSDLRRAMFFLLQSSSFYWCSWSLPCPALPLLSTWSLNIELSLFWILTLCFVTNNKSINILRVSLKTGSSFLKPYSLSFLVFTLKYYKCAHSIFRNIYWTPSMFEHHRPGLALLWHSLTILYIPALFSSLH